MKNIYVCGPTVYSKVHIGNIRPILTYDIYLRSLSYLGIEYNFIHNITDIDDKIITAAAKEGKTEQEIADFYKKHYYEILNKLNIMKPTHSPEVVANMDGIVLFIQKLIDKGVAYEREGNVYFSVLKNSSYGNISNRKLDEMIYEENSLKNYPADFALWKKTDVGITFDSPWAKGRPGWHTECVFFIDKYSGRQLDLHGGGIDLLFPHHENENAQFKELYGTDISKEWRHTGHINMENVKMSKSLGNVLLADVFIEKHGHDFLRLLFASSGITAPININEELIGNIDKTISKYEKAFVKAQLYANNELLNSDSITNVAKSLAEFKYAQAMKGLNEILKQFNKEQNEETAKDLISVFKLYGFKFANSSIDPKAIDLWKKWKKFREEGNYVSADKIRDELVTFGII